MNWYKRNVKGIYIACIPITAALAVTGIAYAIIPLLILAGFTLITGANAFAIHANWYITVEKGKEIKGGKK